MKSILFVTFLSLSFANVSFAGGCTAEQFEAGGKLKDITLPSGKVITICIFPEKKKDLIECNGTWRPECRGSENLHRVSEDGESDLELRPSGEQEL